MTDEQTMTAIGYMIGFIMGLFVGNLITKHADRVRTQGGRNG
jgi:uncharacterized membrane-anchored protein YhcB (DUF1043 family)